MTFDEYQKKALATDLTGKPGQAVLSIGFMDKVLGLVGESGEFADKIKKILRDKSGKISDGDRQELTKELGDVLWYIAVLAKNLDISFDDLASQNISKLARRHQTGKIGGKGDNR
ncbi:MAG TPA: nucleoside triphosphate pyrophosphohydrolase family protein [Patescibacteria group bacterium]|nr:nucleoside triphosphate pyrophosphohydrolase family protein [Patescibacteria group bacterium]